MTASLVEDLAALKGLNSVERKIEYKRETLIPKYRDYVARLREAGGPHELLGYWLVWLFDAGQIEEGLDYAAWAFQAGVKLPERFKASPRFFVAAQLVEWAEAQAGAGRGVEPYFEDTFRAIEADPDAWNLNDDVLGRYYRLRGLMAEQAGDLELAEFSLQRAMTLGSKVKTALDRVRKNASRQAQGSPEPGSAPEDDSPAGAT